MLHMNMYENVHIYNSTKNWFLEQSEIYEVSKSLYCLQVLGHHFLFIICKGFIVVDFSVMLSSGGNLEMSRA
jgi:hypothetical protein